MDKRGTQTDGQKDKKVDDKDKTLHPGDDINCLCQEKKEE